MKVVVLVKAVPVVGTEQLSPDGRVRRDQLEANGADEYAIEKALRLADAGDVEVTLLSMGPAAATDALRKGLAMGAGRAVVVSDEALAGADLRTTVAVLAAALRRLDWDLVLAGDGTTDGGGGVVGQAIAARLGVPCLTAAAEVIPDGDRVTVHRLSATGHDVLTAPMPALVVGTQLLGDPRYPSLRGIMAARSKPIETWSLAELGIAVTPTAPVPTRTEPPAARPGATIVRLPAPEAAGVVADLLATRGLL